MPFDQRRTGWMDLVCFLRTYTRSEAWAVLCVDSLVCLCWRQNKRVKRANLSSYFHPIPFTGLGYVRKESTNEVNYCFLVDLMTGLPSNDHPFKWTSSKHSMWLGSYKLFHEIILLIGLEIVGLLKTGCWKFIFLGIRHYDFIAFGIHLWKALSWVGLSLECFSRSNDLSWILPGFCQIFKGIASFSIRGPNDLKSSSTSSVLKLSFFHPD